MNQTLHITSESSQITSHSIEKKAASGHLYSYTDAYHWMGSVKTLERVSGIASFIEQMSGDEHFVEGLKRGRELKAADALAEEGLGIRYYRLQAGLSQAELADAIGTQQAEISRIESGAQDVSAKRLKRIAAALGIECSVLLDCIAE